MKPCSCFMPVYLILWCLSLVFVGCENTPSNNYPAAEFSDTVAWKTEQQASLGDIVFQDAEGKEVDLKQYHGKKNVLLVITRGYQQEGYGGRLCDYCSTQTSRLIANYASIQALNAEVLVVFPIAKKEQASERLELIRAAQRKRQKPSNESPFPVWLDTELKAVKHLGIEASLAKPATYILDKAGQMRFAYVGQSIADRPSIKAMLDKLTEINHEKS